MVHHTRSMRIRTQIMNHRNTIGTRDIAPPLPPPLHLRSSAAPHPVLRRRAIRTLMTRTFRMRISHLQRRMRALRLAVTPESALCMICRDHQNSRASVQFELRLQPCTSPLWITTAPFSHRLPISPAVITVMATRVTAVVSQRVSNFKCRDTNRLTPVVVMVVVVVAVQERSDLRLAAYRVDWAHRLQFAIAARAVEVVM